MFKALEYYKPGYAEVVQRFEKFYNAAEQKSPGNLVYRALLDSDLRIYENLKLNTYDFTTDKGLQIYVDDLVRELHIVSESRRGVKDDTLPMVMPVLGAGDYSAFVAGEIVFGEDTSWSQPVLNSVDDWKSLPKLGEAIWYRRFLDICERLLDKSASSGVPFMRGFFSPLDLAHALRGNDIYLDFFDSPGQVHGLLSYCADATIMLAEDVFQLAKKYLSDTKMGLWFLEGCINMSEDTACMISPELYRTFAAPHTQRVINHFGRGLLHCHSRALYLIPELCALHGVVNVWVATDPNQTRPIDVLDELIPQANGVGLSLDLESRDDIVRNIEVAKGGNIAFCSPVRDREEANEITALVRKHSVS